MSMSMMRTLIAILGLIGFVVVGDEARADLSDPVELSELPERSCGTPFWYALVDLTDQFALYSHPWRCLGEQPDEPIVIHEGIGDIEGVSFLIGFAPQTYRGGTITIPSDGLLDRHWVGDAEEKLKARGLKHWTCDLDNSTSGVRCGVAVHYPDQSPDGWVESVILYQYDDDVNHGTTEVVMEFDWEEWGVNDPSLNNRFRIEIRDNDPDCVSNTIRHWGWRTKGHVLTNPNWLQEAGCPDRIPRNQVHEFVGSVGEATIAINLRIDNGLPSYVPETYSEDEKSICDISPYGTNPRTLTCRAGGGKNTWAWTAGSGPIEHPNPLPLEIVCLFHPDSPDRDVRLQWSNGHPVRMTMFVQNGWPEYSVEYVGGGNLPISDGTNPKFIRWGHPDLRETIRLRAVVIQPPSAKIVSLESEPLVSRLEPNYPNPFNSTTQIAYHLAASGWTRLAIYNTLGQRVRTLVDAFQAAGAYQVSWDARDKQGSEVAAGVYVTRLIYPGGQETRRLLYLK